MVRVSNKYGNVESSCNVTELIPGLADDRTSSGKILPTFEKEQKAPVFIREPPDLLLLRSGDDLVIECEVHGWPQPIGDFFKCFNS